MVNIRTAVLNVGLVIALAGCHSNAQPQLHSFAAEFQKAVDTVRDESGSGLMTLEVNAGSSAIALLPAHGSAASFKLPEALTHELDQVAGSADTGCLVMIRDGRIVAQERLDPALEITPGYSDRREIYFSMARSKKIPKAVKVDMLHR